MYEEFVKIQLTHHADSENRDGNVAFQANADASSGFAIFIMSGQITTTSAEVTPNGGLVREFPPNPLNSGLGIIVICPDHVCPCLFSPVVFKHLH